MLNRTFRKRVHSFGCSFTFGTDLADDGRHLPWPQASNLTWPALVAKKHGADYLTYARGGAGNLQILDQVLRHLFLSPKSVTPFLWIVNWSYIDRFDYWQSSDTPQRAWHTIRPDNEGHTAKVYYRDLNSQTQDKYLSLLYIHTAITLLEEHGIPFFMTCIDELLFEQKFHCTTTIQNLQDLVRPYIFDFEGTNFLDWSRKKGFDISATSHPLEEAHAAAADLMSPAIDAILHRA